MNLIQAFIWNVGTYTLMLRKSFKWKPHKKLSTNAMCRGGSTRSSDDVPDIQKLYHRREQYRFHLNYSAAKKRIGTELMIKSKKLYFNQNLPKYPVN